MEKRWKILSHSTELGDQRSEKKSFQKKLNFFLYKKSHITQSQTAAGSELELGLLIMSMIHRHHWNNDNFLF
jgi:hypothetical protein